MPRKDLFLKLPVHTLLCRGVYAPVPEHTLSERLCMGEPHINLSVHTFAFGTYMPGKSSGALKRCPEKVP